MPDPQIGNFPRTYSFGVYDVYYEDGRPTSWGADPQHPIGETYDELERDFSNFGIAFGKPILELVDEKLVEMV